MHRKKRLINHQYMQNVKVRRLTWKHVERLSCTAAREKEKTEAQAQNLIIKVPGL